MECLLIRAPNVHFIVRSNTFHAACLLNSSRQSGVAMRKILGGTKKRKIYFEDSPKMPSPDLFSRGNLGGKHSSNPKRSVILNKLFMRHITDQLATGSCAHEILGYGVEINRVQVTSDYKILKVYWLAKGNESDDDVERILQQNSGLLRHELSQLRLMGVVPIIQFVKDKHYARVVELDRKLAIADFGEDHTPVDSAERLKTEFEIMSPLNDNIKKQLEELDNSEINSIEEAPLPTMPQNVLGLNHADILLRIKKSKKKSEALHRTESVDNESDPEENWVTFKLNQSTNENPLPFGDNTTQRIALKEFLQKRQLLRMKARQTEKNYIPDIEYIREELAKRSTEYLEKFDMPENNEEDFVDEDLEDFKIK